MLRQATVSVIVPAYMEERLVEKTLATIPSFVDEVVVVDDASPDRTAEVVRRFASSRVRLLVHEENRGVGAAICSGYQAALEHGADVMAVMAGDAQMDPEDLSAVCGPVAEGRADYVKGNRFAHSAIRSMPVTRRVGGALLSELTRWVTGLEIHDSQCGYTALSARAARQLPLDELWSRYGYPNDLLILLAARGFRVAEVPVRPVYADERSGVRPWHVASIVALMARRALRERQLAMARSTMASAQRRA